MKKQTQLTALVLSSLLSIQSFAQTAKINTNNQQGVIQSLSENSSAYDVTTQSSIDSATESVATMGINSGGGGNSINGFMIEDFRIVSPEKDRRFAKALKVIEKIAQHSPYFASSLRETMSGLKWYVVPVPLRELPNYKTGLSFNSDQSAFQTRGEVFIDEASLNDLEKNGSESTLIVHEILMGEMLQQEGKADASVHARVRAMTFAVLQNYSCDVLNNEIKANGFSRTAAADVWNYLLIEAKGGVSNPTGTSGLIVRKGARIMLYTCSATSLAEFRNNQIESNELIPKGSSFLLRRALQGGGCKLATNSMYTVTKDMAEQGVEFFREQTLSYQKRGAIAGAALAFAVSVAVVEIHAQRNGITPPSRIWGYVGLAAIFGTIGGVAGSASGQAWGKSNEKAPGEAIGLSQSQTAVVQVEKEIPRYMKDLISTYEDLSNRSLVLSTPISAK